MLVEFWNPVIGYFGTSEYARDTYTPRGGIWLAKENTRQERVYDMHCGGTEKVQRSTRGSPLYAVTRKVQAIGQRLEAVNDFQLCRHRCLRGHHRERNAELPCPPRGQCGDCLLILGVS